MNPCRCGWLGDARGRCRCTSEQVQKYRSRVSGPLLDRIDIHVEVPPVPKEVLCAPGARPEGSAAVRRRVAQARERQYRRSACLNQSLASAELERVCRLDAGGQALLERAMDHYGLSAWAYHRILRVARTIADLEGMVDIGEPHIAEAVRYRVLDRSERG